MDLKCVLISDFEKVCRICMEFDKTFLSINSFKIIDMIIACASVQIWENDGLPNHICNGCFLQLKNTINFKQLCENSDNTFREIIQQNKNHLWNNQNNLDDEKNENLDSPNCLIDIKKETTVDDLTRQYFSDNEFEIKNENKSELNRKQTRRKIIQYKFDEDSNCSKNECKENGSNCESEDKKIDLLENYKCEICSKSFKKVNLLGTHMKKIHNSKGIKCGKCSLICYHRLHFWAHDKSHNKCRICNLTFSTHKKLEEHKSTHEDVDIPQIACELCPTILTSKNSLYKHMRFLHKIEKKQSLKCDKCDETFKTKCSLEKHVRKVHPKAKSKYKEQIVNCEICGKSFKRCYLRKHMLTHGERDKIACEYCPKIFISKLTLKHHVKIYHKNSGPDYKCLCNQCGLLLRSNYHLKSHLLTHTDARPYACDKCDKTYRTSFRLKQHISRVHLNVRNFVCTFCSQAFYDKKILLAHIRRHTGEKPFKCQMCDKRFIQKVALRVHMKVHTNSV